MLLNDSCFAITAIRKDKKKGAEFFIASEQIFIPEGTSKDSEIEVACTLACKVFTKNTKETEPVWDKEHPIMRFSVIEIQNQEVHVIETYTE